MQYQVLFYFLRPYKYVYGGILVVMLCASILESLSLAAFFPMFSSVLGESGQGVGGFLGFITSAVKIVPFSDPIVAASVFLMGLYGLKAIFITVREGLIANASGKVLYDIKNRMMQEYAHADYQFFLDSKHGDMIYTTLSAPQKPALLLLRVPQMAAELLKVLAITFVLVFVSPFVTLALALLGVGYYLAVHYLSARVSYHLGKGRTTAAAEQTVIASEFLSGIRHIITFRSIRGWLERFERENQTFSRLYSKDLIWLAIPKSLMELSAVVLLLGLLVFLRVVNPLSFTASLPSIGVFAMALVQLLPAITICSAAAVALALLGVGYYLAVHYLSARVSYHLGKGRTTAAAEQTVIASEFLSGIRHIITFRSIRGWLERFERENQTFSRLYSKDLIWLAIPKSLMELSAVVLLLGLLVFLRVVNPLSFTASLPSIGVFAMALVQLLPAITSFGRMRMELLGVLPDAELVYHSLIGSVPRRPDGTKALRSFEKAIVFKNVSFAHKGKDVLLKNLNLTFEKGKVTAIVGPSGAGKTTLINLILGLFEPTEGRIIIDGKPFQEYELETWLNKIGFVSQDPFIYHSSVVENILFGRNGHSMESVIKAAIIANAHGFISEMPERYETIVGDRGMKLSGGQQQRIAIARAILDEPEVLILDEATSSLDSASERLVQEAIDNVTRERTVLIIAHRLSTIRYADKIIVLDDGQIIEEGTHQELMRKQGSYSHLVNAARE